MIDPAKIRVGDRVTVRAKVIELGLYGLRIVDSIMFDQILSHTPAPRPFVVGGKVRPINRHHPHPVATVLCIHEGQLWLLDESGRHYTAEAKHYEPIE